MQAKVEKWGDSLAVRLPQSYVDELGLEEGGTVEINVVDGGLLIKSLQSPRYTLDELLADLAAKGSPLGDAPQQGDIVWLTPNPQEVGENAERLPAFVVSPSTYNRFTGLMLVCTIVSDAIGDSFEVNLPDNHPIAGVILTDQVQCVSWRAQASKFGAKTSDEILGEVLAKVDTLLTLDPH